MIITVIITWLEAAHWFNGMILTSTPSSLALGSELVSEVVPNPVTFARESGAGE